MSETSDISGGFDPGVPFDQAATAPVVTPDITTPDPAKTKTTKLRAMRAELRRELKDASVELNDTIGEMLGVDLVMTDREARHIARGLARWLYDAGVSTDDFGFVDLIVGFYGVSVYGGRRYLSFTADRASSPGGGEPFPNLVDLVDPRPAGEPS